MTKYFKFPEDATPINDCSGLIPTWVYQLKDLNRVEAENILRAQRKYLQGAIQNPKYWFNVSELKNIHRAMFDHVWQWAGMYRKSTTSIGIHPGLIPSRLAEFCFEVISWLQHPVDLTFVEMAARIHHRLVFIHPFENGNGRFSRFIADRFLLAFKCSHPMWPNQLNQEGIIRKDYIKTLKNADKGDYTALVHFMKKLGAHDPHLSELLKNKFYQSYLKGETGVSLVKALLKNHGDPNDQTTNGYRPLQLAIKAHLEEIIKVLIDFGAEINAKDKSGLTPFQTAAIQKNKNLTDFLLSKGAESN